MLKSNTAPKGCYKIDGLKRTTNPPKLKSPMKFTNKRKSPALLLSAKINRLE